MTHTEDLIHRLRDTASRGVSSWGDLQQEAADELQALMNAVAAEREASERRVKILTDALAESRREIFRVEKLIEEQA